MKRIVLLGSSGSVGESALRLVENQREHFQVVGLAALRNATRLVAQAREFAVPRIALASEEAAAEARALARGASVEIFGGPNAVLDLLAASEFDLVLHAITGAAGLPASIETLRRGRALALANKESLVIAGELMAELSRKHAAAIVPVDSEHSAIFQCVRHERRSKIRKIYLTASGGPFRDRPPGSFDSVTREEALQHPNWIMGERITVGSATMMNKAFEIVEAHHLFGLHSGAIRVLLHRQSIVHSMVEFDDGSMLAQLGVPDMRIPIQVALHHPDRGPFDFEPFDPVRFSSLTFTEPDAQRYPALALGYRCVERGGTSGAILNAADEVATRRFLAGEIRFPEIARIAAEALDEIPVEPADRVERILAADARARAYATGCASAGVR